MTFYSQRKSITELARELRTHMTPSEKRVWRHLRKKKMMGYRFLRQKPFVLYEPLGDKQFIITDFYCAELNLVIEIDGGIHQSLKELDNLRDKTLDDMGFKVMRIKNEETFSDLLLIDKIKSFIKRECL